MVMWRRGSLYASGSSVRMYTPHGPARLAARRRGRAGPVYGYRHGDQSRAETLGRVPPECFSRSVGCVQRSTDPRTYVRLLGFLWMISSWVEAASCWPARGWGWLTPAWG